MAAILIVDDELVLVQQLDTALQSAGHEVRTAQTAGQGLEFAREDAPDLVLLDLRLPDRSGLELIPELKQIDANLLVVLMTGYGSERDAIEAVRRGASDYLHKPLDVGELGLLIERLLRQRQQDCELRYLRARELSGATASLRSGLREILDQVARLCDPGLPAGARPAILLSGEPGSGKRLAARAIHESFGGGPFIQVDCAGRRSDELARELFGTTESPTERARTGLFEAADRGSLLLHEVADIPADLQRRLLGVLKTHRVSRVGSNRERAVNVHVLATTSRELDGPDRTANRNGSVSGSLVARLRTVSFAIPPLRERKQRLGAIAGELADSFGLRFDGRGRELSGEAEALLLAYEWPGNLRELQIVIERAIMLSPEQRISAEVVGRLLGADVMTAVVGRVLLPDEGIRLEDVERDLLKQALDRARGNQTRASSLLGLSRDTLRYRIAKWGLDKTTESV